MMWRLFAWMVLSVLLTVSAHAEADYKDDRSSAADVVRSLYNAINRHEYARAYDYFVVPPAKDYAAYEAGFAETDHVEVLLGEASQDGAAGKTYYSIPTAIKSTDTKGNTKYFSGCYTVVAVNGGIQEPPSRPYQIDKGALKPIAKDDFVTYALPKCGPEPELTDENPSVEKAKALFASEQRGQCAKVDETLAGENEPAVYNLKYRDLDAGADQPDRMVVLYVFSCELYAYNESFVFYTHDDVSGLKLLSFAEPHVVTTHPKGDDEGAKLKSIKVDGFESSTSLINADFDEKAQTISSFNKWRGIADASSSGAWRFDRGEFILKDYDVDPTYNGENDPITVMQDGMLQKLP
jgi:Protein of unknown function (DUF1176)